MTDNTESHSYKFQRLRERIREAVAKGELHGKLPGERVLAKQFHVNAKTLSKALTDLAAEGILDRSIGRGTYVKGQAPALPMTTGRWLVLTDGDASEELLAALRNQNAGLHVMTEAVDRVRPSFINQFSAVVDLSSNTPDSFFRNLAVRNIAVIAIGREPQTISMNAVLIDSQLGVSRLTRDLLLAGHRRFAAVAQRGDTNFAQVIQQVAAPFEPDSTVDLCDAKDVALAVRNGATAVICDSPAAARDAAKSQAASGQSAPIVAVGLAEGAIPCAGYFVSPAEIAKTVADLLAQPHSRPTVMWLAGEFNNFKDSGIRVPTPRSNNNVQAGA